MTRSALAASALFLLLACKKPPAVVHVETPVAHVMPNGAGAIYLRIVDDDDGGDRLVSVTSADARDCQLHETVEDGDVTSMRHAKDGFPVPAHGALALEHGGRHVMVFGVRDPKAPRLRLTLHFERAGAIDVDVPIEQAFTEHAAEGRRTLRVCADPNNLPFSNAREEGFENRLARMVARDLDADLSFTWSPQRRGFFRNTLNAKRCDVVIGVPKNVDMVATTKPYYRSSYVFVLGPKTKRVASLDAPELRTMRIGAPLVGDDGANPPPMLALAPRNLAANLHGYSVYDAREGGASAEIARALRAGEIDVALAWGPSGAYWAAKGEPVLAVARMRDEEAPKGLTFHFDIAMGVRREDAALADELDRFIDRRHAEIDALLDEFHVPRG